MQIQTDLTVAAIVERDDCFLMVEEYVAGELVFNQPAGHIEAGETPEQAVIRETLEESAWHVTPRDILGAYLWHLEDGSRRFLRIAFVADCEHHDSRLTLDTGIVRAVWMTLAEIRTERRRLRTPMVLRCVEDYQAGQRAHSLQAHLNGIPDDVNNVLALAHVV